MGAVAALMHADRDPSIAGLILDSPFSSLRQLAEDLCKLHTKIPKFIMSGALSMIKSSIQSKAKFDINDLNPLKNHVEKAFIPALFVAGKEDTFISPEHTKALHKAYAGDKNLILVEGDHNSQRPQFMLDSVGIFFYNTLQVEFLISSKEDISKNNNEKTVPNIYDHIINQQNVDNERDVYHDLYHMTEFDKQMNEAIGESIKASQCVKIHELKESFDLLSLDSIEPYKIVQNHSNPNQHINLLVEEEEEKKGDQFDDYFGFQEKHKYNLQDNLNNKNKDESTSENKQNNQIINDSNVNIISNKYSVGQNPLAEYFEDYNPQ